MHDQLTLKLTELKRLRVEPQGLLVYKLLFSLLCMNNKAFFTSMTHAHLRGVDIMLEKQRCIKSARQSSLCNRVVDICSSLLSDTTYFSSFQRVRKSLRVDYSAQSCKMNFNWRLSSLSVFKIFVLLYRLYNIVGLLFYKLLCLFQRSSSLLVLALNLLFFFFL